ncbi:RAQPRD family integrative conjugative element protein [Orbus sturtevantii]|uniref:integrative conjugative element protein, RAQPRD family n=1 Tax=Orbus sturtevantii TaxID=3074109 RepID=UPI00370D013E
MRISLSKRVLCILTLLLLGTNIVQATEKEELALITKQLTQVKESLLRSEIVSGTEQAQRYHFNYQAAQSDINQIILGIENYLSPSRMQPRSLNFPVITGEYQDESAHD